MNYHVLTLFPEMFNSYFNESIIARAIESKIIEINIYNIRDYSIDKNKKVDDRPFGGGPGMIISVDPVIKCIDSVVEKINSGHILKQVSKIKIIMFSPGGVNFNTSIAKDVVKDCTDIIFICGRYEGVDSRVIDICKDNNLDIEEWSIGDYVLTGGELPAMVCIDSISRQVSGVLGKFESLEEERVSSHKFYTRPPVYEYESKQSGYNLDIAKNSKIKTIIKKVVNKFVKTEKRSYPVPEVLISGNHKLIDEWKNNNQ